MKQQSMRHDSWVRGKHDIMPQELMQYSINVQAAVFPNTGISSKLSRASECLLFGRLLLCQVFGGLIDCTLPLVLMSNPIHKKEHAYVLFGTLAVWVHHITHSVFDVGPNSIQVLSHTICNKPSIPLKSASSTTNCCLLDSDMELENFQISMNQKTNLLSCEIIPCMSWLMWMWLRSCSVLQMSNKGFKTGTCEFYRHLLITKSKKEACFEHSFQKHQVATPE